MTGSSPANHENKSVIPAQAGIQNNIKGMDSCFRRNDNNDPSYFLGNSKIQTPKFKNILYFFNLFWTFGILNIGAYLGFGVYKLEFLFIRPSDILAAHISLRMPFFRGEIKLINDLSLFHHS